VSIEPALSIAFFDPERGVHGSARSGVTLLFEDAHASALEPAEIELDGSGGAHARLAGRIDVRLEPVAEPFALGGARITLCKATGAAASRRVDGVGTITETLEPPGWEELDALRGLSALFGEGDAVFAVARRPRGSAGHGEEAVDAVIVTGGVALPVEDARLSTVYDADGRQRTAGLELWLPDQEFPRRGFGTVLAGTTLLLERMRVHASVFRWRMEGREGLGAYDVVLRDEPVAA
jgi:hypothetical protein